MKFQQAIEDRRSIRKFKNIDVSNEIIRSLIENAR